MARDYYDLLDLARTATTDEIERRFRFLRRAYDPAKFATNAEKERAQKTFEAIHAAYDVLIDPVKRAQYDSSPRPQCSRAVAAAAPGEPQRVRSFPPVGHKATLIGLTFAALIVLLFVIQRMAPDKRSVGAFSPNDEEIIRANKRAQQSAAIKTPNPGESVEFELAVYPNEWSPPISIPDDYHLVTELQGQPGLKIWCATDDNTSNGVLMRKGTPSSSSNAGWELWSWSFVGIYNPLARRPAYADGPKARSVRYKSGENFAETLRVRLEPGRITANNNAQRSVASDLSTPLPTTPPVAREEERRVSPPVFTSTPNVVPSVAVESPPSFIGERYPDTRTRIFAPAELQSWSTDQLQYAINEIFARHGGTFPDKKVGTYFAQFAWYHPKSGIGLDQIESSLPYIEQQNVHVFGAVRNIKRNPLSVAAGPWSGILYWRDGSINKHELVFSSDLNQVQNRSSNLEANSGWNTFAVKRNGSTLAWQVPGPGRTSYFRFTPDQSGQQAQLTAQIVQQGRVAYSASGICFRYDVAMPTGNISTPDPQAQQNSGAQGNSKPNTATVNRRRQP